MSNLNKIAKNTTMLFVSQIISYVLAFFYFLFIQMIMAWTLLAELNTLFYGLSHLNMDSIGLS